MGLICLYFTDATDRQAASICSYSHLHKPISFGYIPKRQAMSTVYILSPARIWRAVNHHRWRWHVHTFSYKSPFAYDV